MGELKLTGNCLKGSRPLLSFDETFETAPQYALLKEMLTQIFGTPAHHPKSQPFTDRVVTFSILDNRIWFRNFQILTEDGALAEIGPRFVLNPIKIFENSFGGETLWDNSKYVTPAKYRRQVKLSACNKYVDRIQQKENYYATEPKVSYKVKPNDDIFEGNPLEKAKEISEKVKHLKELNQHQLKTKNKSNINKKKAKKNISKKSSAIPSFKVESESSVSINKGKKNLKKSMSQNGFTVS